MIKYSECKEIINGYDRDILEALINYSSDLVEVGNTYIIKEDEVLEYVCNMYRGDLYILGCFNAGFIEDYIALDYEDIKAIQEGEQFEIIGKLIMNSGNFEDMIAEYIRLDGYGHALSSYSHNYDEITFNDEDFILAF